jgi:hypothetical protein
MVLPPVRISQPLSYGPAVTLLGVGRPYYYCFQVSPGLLFQPFPDDKEVLHPRSRLLQAFEPLVI